MEQVLIVRKLTEHGYQSVIYFYKVINSTTVEKIGCQRKKYIAYKNPKMFLYHEQPQDRYNNKGWYVIDDEETGDFLAEKNNTEIKV